jgi:glutamate--cysteine ligase
MTLRIADLHADLARAFGLGAPVVPTTFGLEVEAIPVERLSGRPLPLTRTLDALGSLTWTTYHSPKSGATELHRPDGARLTFEPGGQVEYSSAPHHTGTTLLSDVEIALDAIDTALQPIDGKLLFVGLDPVTPVSDVPLQLTGARYQRMDAYFASRSPAGRRMMRQTASVQLCVGTGPDPLQRWRLLSALAPIVTAMFANSPLNGGVPTGECSYRRRIWAELDPSRTGLRAFGVDPVTEYLEFALQAPAFLMGSDPQLAQPFRDWIERGATDADWQTHLSTLFPDVRPRGYFELRVADSVHGDALAAMIALVGGIVSHADAERVAKLFPNPTPELMTVAGRDGLEDAVLRDAAVRAIALTREAERTTGDALLDHDGWSRAGRFFANYTLCGRTPADDVRALTAA